MRLLKNDIVVTTIVTIFVLLSGYECNNFFVGKMRELIVLRFHITIYWIFFLVVFNKKHEITFVKKRNKKVMDLKIMNWKVLMEIFLYLFGTKFNDLNCMQIEMAGQSSQIFSRKWFLKFFPDSESLSQRAKFTNCKVNFRFFRPQST